MGKHIFGQLYIVPKNLFWLMEAIEQTDKLMEHLSDDSDEKITDEWFEALQKNVFSTAGGYFPQKSSGEGIKGEDKYQLMLREEELSTKINSVIILLKFYRGNDVKIHGFLQWLQEKGLVDWVYRVSRFNTNTNNLEELRQRRMRENKEIINGYYEIKDIGFTFYDVDYFKKGVLNVDLMDIASKFYRYSKPMINILKRY